MPGREDVRNPEPGCHPPHGDIRILVRHAEHPGRRSQQRSRTSVPDQLDGKVALVDAPQHSRHNPPPVDRRPAPRLVDSFSLPADPATYAHARRSSLASRRP
jgi:hypothetical protein